MSLPGRSWDIPEDLLGVDEAIARILAAFSPLEPVSLTPLNAAGLILADDVIASMDLPPFDNSAMDGFALRSEDTANSPASLRVIGTVPAGSVSSSAVSPGTALKIMTGAPIPDGADAVIRVEETDEHSGTVMVSRRVQVGENIRPAGEDVRSGTTALAAGSRIRAAEVGMLAALDVSVVRVHPRPRVGILTTGDELVEPGRALKAGTIRNSNGPMLAAAIAQIGGIAVDLGVASDNRQDLLDRLKNASGLDLLLTTGGVSVGERDIVKDVLRSAGKVEVWGVRMKPGKPLAFGSIGDVPVIGLPGNPVAALVAFDQFARPAILKMLGRQDVWMPCVTAVLGSRVENRGGRRHFVRGTLSRQGNDRTFYPSARRGSSVLSSATGSHCYLVIPEDRDSLEAGEMVTVQLPEEGL